MHFVKFLIYDSEGSDFVDRISWTKEWKGMQTGWVRCSDFVVGCPLPLMDFVEAFLEGTPSFLYKIRAPDPLGVIGGGMHFPFFNDSRTQSKILKNDKISKGN